MINDRGVPGQVGVTVLRSINCASPREAGILANFRVSVFVRPLF